jgi:hypothetical protein
MEIPIEVYRRYAELVSDILLVCQRSHCRSQYWIRRSGQRLLLMKTMGSGISLIKTGSLMVLRESIANMVRKHQSKSCMRTADGVVSKGGNGLLRS